MVSIAISGIQNPGNLGAIARVLKNFNLKEFYLINPECDPKDQEARNRAKHAQDILENITILKSIKELKNKFNTVIGTTGKLGTDYNLPRSPLTPNQVFPLKDKNTVILFGSEEHGLTNEEIKECDFLITIPASKKYPILNISHAVAIICYELFKTEKDFAQPSARESPRSPQSNEELRRQRETEEQGAHSKGETKEHSVSHINFAAAKEKEIILNLFNDILKQTEFAAESKRETQRKTIKNIIGKSSLTKREAFALIGFLKKLKH